VQEQRQKWHGLRGRPPRPAACLPLTGLRISNELGALPHDAMFGASPIEPTRTLMNRNPNPGARELVHPNMGETRPEPADGNSPFRQVLAAPGGDAGPLACGAPANSTVLAGVPGWRSTGRRPVPRYTVARISRLYRLQRPRRRPWQSGPPESAYCPGHLSPGRRKLIHDYPRHFPEFLPLASSRRRPANSRTGAASRRDTG